MKHLKRAECARRRKKGKSLKRRDRKQDREILMSFELMTRSGIYPLTYSTLPRRAATLIRSNILKINK